MNKKLTWATVAGIGAFGYFLGQLIEQPGSPKLPPKFPHGLRQIQDVHPPQPNEESTKPDHPDEFARLHWDFRTRAGDEQPAYPANYRLVELEKARRSARALAKLVRAPLPWKERGPGNVGGRTRGLVVDPGDTTYSTWFAGSVGGGIWKTDDGGQAWINKTPDLPNLATTALAIAPSNPNVLYAGTGEGFFNFGGVNGAGIFKSGDRGESWRQLQSTASNLEFQNVNRLVVDPADDNILLAATNIGFTYPIPQRASGIFRSLDGGATWTKVYDAGTNRVQDIVANPENFKTLFAGVNGVGVVRSFDGGRTWARASEGMGAVQRVEVAVAPTDTARIYAAVEVDASISALYISENNGESWLASSEEIGFSPNWLGGQGWYNNALAVHPYDKNVVFLGGINVWQVAFQVKTGLGEGILSFEEENSSSFLSFVDFGGTHANGGVVLVEREDAISLEKFEYTSVEIRFGPGVAQKAHRFSAPDASGVPPEQYAYEDYIDVPFEVWDITNDLQLMVSFRDRKNDGAFNLIEFDPGNVGREYLFVNAVPYDPNDPDPNIAADGMHIYKNIYFIWPILATGATWDPANLPDSYIRINYGSLTRFRRTDELTNWFPDRENPNHPSGVFPFVHADHHNLTMIPIDPAKGEFHILNANDGGVEISRDGGVNWSKTLNGYNTTQHFGVDKKPGESFYLAGMQDNGTWLSPPNPAAVSAWEPQLGGDGLEVIWHYENPERLIASLPFTQIYRSLDGGSTWNLAIAGVNDAVPFFTQVGKSNSDPDLLFFAGAAGVWRSDNFADSWTLSPISPVAWSFTGSFAQARISLANPQIVWAGQHMSSGGKLHVSTDGGLSFAPTNNYQGATLGRISGMATHPSRDSTAFVLFSIANSPKILRTQDLGLTWEDISGFASNSAGSNGFPDVATYSLLVMPHDPNTIWAGTEIGLFETMDEGLTWHLADSGLPAVSIWKMRVVDDQVVVATHGRGVWSVTLPELLNAPPPAVTRAPRLNSLSQTPQGKLDINVSLRSQYDSTFVVIEEKTGQSTVKILNRAPVDTTISLSLPASPEGRLIVSLTAFKEGVAYKSAKMDYILYPLAAAESAYSNDFNSSSAGFAGPGFQIFTATGFQDGAIHSDHPYTKNLNISYQLLTPIIVADRDARLSYDEIVLVEPGEEGSIAGEEAFRDYVVVEGTKNGFNWLPLLDAYDSRAQEDWLDAYNSAQLGDPALFRNRIVDLNDVFAAGDQILIRFRFVSDRRKNGWGWAVDNLAIQEGITSVESNPLQPYEFALAQNYPNPFNPTTNIEYVLPVDTKVTIAIYNALGQKVVTLLEDISQKAGVHRAVWNGRNEVNLPVSSGIYFYHLHAGKFRQARKMTLLR